MRYHFNPTLKIVIPISQFKTIFSPLISLIFIHRHKILTPSYNYYKMWNIYLKFKIVQSNQNENFQFGFKLANLKLC
jgi:hypothetical protein